MNADLIPLADALFACGAVKFGAFKLKLHETKPDAPLSPIYFNLRTPDNPKPGPLTPEILDMVGESFSGLANVYDVDHDTVVAGIPNAGDPLAVAYAKNLEKYGQQVQIIQLVKEESGGTRKIAGVKDHAAKGKKVLLIDDLITQADTKLEAARVVEEDGGIVAAFLVMLDRQQGGTQQLEAAGYEVLYLFTLSALLEHYVRAGSIAADKQAEVLAYVAENSV